MKTSIEEVQHLYDLKKSAFEVAKRLNAVPPSTIDEARFRFYVMQDAFNASILFIDAYFSLSKTDREKWLSSRSSEDRTTSRPGSVPG